MASRPPPPRPRARAAPQRSPRARPRPPTRGLRRRGRGAVFSNPGGVAPLGAIFASITDRDGPSDKAAKLAGYHHLTRLGELTPHPVYAWMPWVQLLSPSRPQYESLKPLLAESLETIKAKWMQGTAG